MNKKLLWFKINGIKELDGLVVNLLATDQKNEDEKFYNLVRAFPNNDQIFLNKTSFINGRNASGKTSLLKLIMSIEQLTDPNRHAGVIKQNLLFSFFGDTKNKISIKSYHSISNFIFKHEITLSIIKNNFLVSGPESLYEAKIHKESFSHVSVSQNTSSKKLLNLFEDDERWNNLAIVGDDKFTKIFNVEFSDKIRPINTKMNSINYSKISDYMLNIIFANEFKKEFFGDFDNVYKQIMNGSIKNELSLKIQELIVKSEDLIKDPSHYITSNHITNLQFFRYAIDQNFYQPFIKAFDQNVEEIWLTDDNYWSVRLKGESRPRLNKKLEDILSTGTIRGIEIFSLIMFKFKYGGDIFIDEIEQNFNHKIVTFIIDLFNDPDLNTSSRLFATTHYLKTLDSTTRRDNIFFTEIKDKTLYVTSLNAVKDISRIVSKRSDYTNSKLVEKMFSFNLQPGLIELNKTKRLLKHKMGEISYE